MVRFPPFFNFPVGTMFWARPKVLKSMFDLKLDWRDYPEEPIPIDGTILHALERLLPFAARHSGYRVASTSIPGVDLVTKLQWRNNSLHRWRLALCRQQAFVQIFWSATRC